MQVVTFPARQARTNYRHELCRLTYVVLDAGNGGVIRNLNRTGVAVQAVAPLRPQQRVRLRFELKSPRMRVETYGQVSWTRSSGQCGIRFVNLPVSAARQIDEWLFSDLLDAVARRASDADSMFAQRHELAGPIAVPPRFAPIRIETGAPIDGNWDEELNWLSRPLSGKTLARMVDGLSIVAALLLFALIFISIVHDLPRWPLALAALVCAVSCAAGAYFGLFALFGEPTLGVYLAQAESSNEEVDDDVGRFG